MTMETEDSLHEWPKWQGIRNGNNSKRKLQHQFFHECLEKGQYVVRNKTFWYKQLADKIIFKIFYFHPRWHNYKSLELVWCPLHCFSLGLWTYMAGSPHCKCPHGACKKLSAYYFCMFWCFLLVYHISMKHTKNNLSKCSMDSVLILLYMMVFTPSWLASSMITCKWQLDIKASLELS